MNELLNIFQRYQTEEIQGSDERLINTVYASITRLAGTTKIKLKMNKFLGRSENKGNFIAQENCNT